MKEGKGGSQNDYQGCPTWVTGVLVVLLPEMEQVWRKGDKLSFKSSMVSTSDGVWGSSLKEKSFQFSHSVVSDSSRRHELQHARLPCPSPNPGAYSNSCPSSWWCIQPSHPLLSISPPAPNPPQHQGLFQWVNSLHEVAKYWSLSFSSILTMSTQDWSPLGWTGWISLQSKGLSLLQHYSSKA